MHPVPVRQLVSVLGSVAAGLDSTQAASFLDPPNDFTRARLVLVLLRTSGHYFVKGSQRPKLDRFMVHLQCYMLAKEEAPADVAFDFADTFAALQPGVARCALCTFPGERELFASTTTLTTSALCNLP